MAWLFGNDTRKPETTNIKAEVTSECSIYISAEQLCQRQDYRQAIDFQAQGQYLYTRLQAVNSAVLQYKWQIFDQKKQQQNNSDFMAVSLRSTSH